MGCFTLSMSIATFETACVGDTQHAADAAGTPIQLMVGPGCWCYIFCAFAGATRALLHWVTPLPGQGIGLSFEMPEVGKRWQDNLIALKDVESKLRMQLDAALQTRRVSAVAGGVADAFSEAYTKVSGKDQSSRLVDMVAARMDEQISPTRRRNGVVMRRADGRGGGGGGGGGGGRHSAPDGFADVVRRAQPQRSSEMVLL